MYLIRKEFSLLIKIKATHKRKKPAALSGCGSIHSRRGGGDTNHNTVRHQIFSGYRPDRWYLSNSHCRTSTKATSRSIGKRSISASRLAGL